MEVVGLIHAAKPVEKVSDKFSKREFVLQTDFDSPYPQFCLFQLTQAKVSMLDDLQTGDMVKVQFNLRGREWNGPNGVQYFNTLEAWRVEKVAKSPNK